MDLLLQHYQFHYFIYLLLHRISLSNQRRQLFKRLLCRNTLLNCFIVCQFPQRKRIRAFNHRINVPMTANEMIMILYNRVHLNWILMSYTYSVDTVKASDADQPLDTISCIIWDLYRAPTQYALLCGGWDGLLRYYQMNSYNELKLVWSLFLQQPILTCDLAPNNIALAGLASGDLLAVNLSNNLVVQLGKHDAPIAGVFWVHQFSCVLTLGFDQCLRFWTLEGPNFMQVDMRLPYKTHTASFDFPFLLIGSCDSTGVILDLSTLPNINIPQTYQTYTIEKYSKFSCCRINAQCKRVVLGTIDGRAINYQFINPYDNPMDPFVTRVQKKVTGSTTTYGQINAVDLSVFNNSGYCGIGGSEEFGLYNIKRRIKSKPITSTGYNTTPVTAIRIHPSGNYVAYATGTDWTKGLNELESIKKPKILLVKVKESELIQLISNK